MVDVEDFVLERAIRAKLGSVTSAQVPDAIAVMRSSQGQRFALSVEIDTGSENPSYLVRNKAEPYAAFRREGVSLWGCSRWSVVCIVPTKRRLHRLVSAFYDADALPRGLWFFAVAEQITAQSIFTDTPWMTLQLNDENAQLVAKAPFSEFIKPVITTRHDRNDDLPTDK